MTAKTLEKAPFLAAPTSGFWAWSQAWAVYRVVETGELVVKYSSSKEAGQRLIPVRKTEFGWVFEPH